MRIFRTLKDQVKNAFNYILDNEEEEEEEILILRGLHGKEYSPFFVTYGARGAASSISRKRQFSDARARSGKKKEKSFFTS